MKQIAFVKSAVLAGSALIAGLSFAGETSPKAPIAPEPPSDISVSISAGYTSEYVYRGGFLGNDLFDFGLEASGSGELGGLGELGFTAGIWYASFSGISYSDTFTSGGGNELDVYGEVSKDFGTFGLALGITNYSYFGVNPVVSDDIEPYLSLGTELAGISFGVAAYYDESDSYGHEIYWELSAGYGIELGSMSLDLSATYGYFDDVEEEYIALSAGLDIPVSDSISVTPHVTTTFSDDLGDQTYAGVGLGFGF